MSNLGLFSERLKELRTKLGLTQKDLATKIGVTSASLSAYETNTKNPSLGVAIDIAQKCNVSIDWLCGLSENGNKNINIQTYADIIKFLLLVEEKVNINIRLYTKTVEEVDCFSEKLESVPVTYNFYNIFFDDSHLNDFIKEWDKMKILHDDKTIDDDVYSLWIEKTLRKYNININVDFNNDDGFLPFS